jgi:hypothetical protein
VKGTRTVQRCCYDATSLCPVDFFYWVGRKLFCLFFVVLETFSGAINYGVSV